MDYSIKNNEIKIMKYLLMNGKKPSNNYLERFPNVSLEMFDTLTEWELNKKEDYFNYSSYCFLKLVENNNYKVLEKLFPKFTKTIKNSDLKKACEICSEKGYFETIQLLFQLISSNPFLFTYIKFLDEELLKLLKLSCKNNHYNVVKFLIEKTNSSNFDNIEKLELLNDSIISNNIEIVKLISNFIDYQIDNDKLARSELEDIDDEEFIQELEKFEYCIFNLFDRYNKTGNYGIIQFFINNYLTTNNLINCYKFIDRDEGGYDLLLNPLYLACLSSDLSIVRLVINNGGRLPNNLNEKYIRDIFSKSNLVIISLLCLNNIINMNNIKICNELISNLDDFEKSIKRFILEFYKNINHTENYEEWLKKSEKTKKQKLTN